MKNTLIYLTLLVTSIFVGCQKDLTEQDNADFVFELECDGVQTFYRGESFSYSVNSVGVSSVDFTAPDAWSVVVEKDEITVTAPKDATEDEEGEIIFTAKFKNKTKKVQTVEVFLDSAFEAGVSSTWVNFAKGNKDNVLLDFSYAGYMHGEVGPPDAESLGYKVFNIVDYGADGTDEVSDRDAFKAAVRDLERNGSGILYVPEGRFILHEESDNVYGVSKTINIITGNVILKGAGQDKTFLEMKDPNIPSNPSITYGSESLISIYHRSGDDELTKVTARAARGTFSVEVASASKIKAGDWVYLNLNNNNPELLAEELAPYEPHPTMTDMLNGVRVVDYHQVTKVEGNVITFKEPIMRAVDPKWDWTVRSFPNYSNVGVEDLTFVGHCKTDYSHGASWEDDGAYKMINFHRLTNSWMERVTFLNVSEASSVISCANMSVTDVTITGRRGHSAVRSQGSSRLFMGNMFEDTDGKREDGTYGENIGQWHACGVSKTSMGAVLWNSQWGDDSTFETHSSQPRATLIDNCYGALLRSRAGGAESNLPNHLAGLTLWNLTTMRANYNDKFDWWNMSSTWWKFMPPVIVGYNGVPINFNQEQVLADESNGTKVHPESLYEAQLELRLGYLPAWISELKSNSKKNN